MKTFVIREVGSQLGKKIVCIETRASGFTGNPRFLDSLAVTEYWEEMLQDTCMERTLKMLVFGGKLSSNPKCTLFRGGTSILGPASCSLLEHSRCSVACSSG